MITPRFCKKTEILEKCDFTKFDSKVHTIINQMNRLQNWSRFWVENYLYRVREKCKG